MAQSASEVFAVLSSQSAAFISSAAASGPTSWTSFDAVKTPLPSQAQVNDLVGSRGVASDYRAQILSLLKFTNETTFNYELPTKDFVYYSFDLDDMVAPTATTAKAMNAEQKGNVRKALDEVTRVTGVKFVETTGAYPKSGDKKEGLVFVNEDRETNHYGQDYTRFQDQTTVFEDRSGGPRITSLTKNDTIGINMAAKDMGDYAPGGTGFDTVLHEIGHALGLSHPFSDSSNQPAYSSHPNTIMSYDFNSVMKTYGPLDIDALHWIYGDDGLLGNKGLTVNPTTFAPVANGMNAASSGWFPSASGGGSTKASASPQILEYVLTYDDGQPDVIECVPGTFETGPVSWGIGPDGAAALFAFAAELVERDPAGGFLIEPWTGLATAVAPDVPGQATTSQGVDEDGLPVITQITGTITYDEQQWLSALSAPASLAPGQGENAATAILDWRKLANDQGVLAAV